MMSTNYICDVAIIGAGPAGSTAALNLARAGHHVILLEQKNIQKDKPCGGGITFRILNRFPYLREGIDSVTLNRVSEVCFYSPSFHAIESQSGEPYYLMVKRNEFDSMLVDRCIESGVTVLESSRVTHVDRTQSIVEVMTRNGSRVVARSVLGADGVNSITARSVGLDERGGRTGRAVCLLRETSDEPEEIMAQKCMHVFYGYKQVMGYGWVFPKKHCINVGFGVAANSKIRLQELWHDFVNELKKRRIVSRSFSSQGFKGGIVPIGRPFAKTYSDRVLLCGDAAGFVNSYTAEGIYYSMVSGEIAAKVLSNALNEDDLSASRLREYQREWSKEIGSELEKSFLISEALLKKPARIEKVIEIANRDFKIKQILADYTVGKIDYPRLKSFVLKRMFPFYLTWKTKAVLEKVIGSLK